MEIAERLVKAKAIIANPRDWGKGEDRDCACALDALRVGIDETDNEQDVMRAAGLLRDCLPFSFKADPNNWNTPVAQFNDAPETTHADIMALYDRAIAKAEGRSHA
ncbi:hypothetical protein GR212_15625 [Rhizobium lusitanum]|uniref:Uncharacterized protein n=1 Tax=Rhizobium lusitanum TaxID=293958 RepID=A0A6L9U903_9HYPH|nr:hypothetical protein [Rhizobium lusitanum]NEI71008.1 hypothetical protein [Rhizobium lusitanum]